MTAVFKLASRGVALIAGLTYVGASVLTAFDMPTVNGVREGIGFGMGLLAYFACGTFLIGVALDVDWAPREGKQG
jgi:hypothetical protein